MPLHTSFTELLKIDHPIIQAPMAGGGDTPELVVAVSNAGALGSIGAAYLTPEQILATVNSVRNKTDRPFGINLFAPQPAPPVPDDVTRALRALSGYYSELGLPAPEPPQLPPDRFDQQMQAVLDSGASVFSFTFGTIPPDAVAAAKSRGILVVGTATTVDEALQLQHLGCDAVVAQGSEAGGHRGTFASEFSSAMIGTIALVPQIVDAVTIPVIASGGIMDGRGIAAALALGAVAVQMGTAFLICTEAGVPEAYKHAILNSREDQTRITRAFSGRPARGIVNRLMTEVDPLDNVTPPILPFPLQNILTRPLRTAAAKQGRAEFLSLWAGQAVRLARRQSAAELVARLAQESEHAISLLNRVHA
jgi:nitronate monooxygenase